MCSEDYLLTARHGLDEVLENNNYMLDGLLAIICLMDYLPTIRRVSTKLNYGLGRFRKGSSNMK